MHIKPNYYMFTKTAFCFLKIYTQQKQAFSFHTKTWSPRFSLGVILIGGVQD